LRQDLVLRPHRQDRVGRLPHPRPRARRAEDRSVLVNLFAAGFVRVASRLHTSGDSPLPLSPLFSLFRYGTAVATGESDTRGTAKEAIMKKSLSFLAIAAAATVLLSLPSAAKAQVSIRGPHGSFSIGGGPFVPEVGAYVPDPYADEIYEGDDGYGFYYDDVWYPTVRYG